MSIIMHKYRKWCPYNAFFRYYTFHVVCNIAVCEKGLNKWSYCLPKETTDSEMPGTS